MAKHLVFILLILISSFVFSQNLVMNYNFNQIDSCPVLQAIPQDNFKHCLNWFERIPTLDLYHSCMPTSPFDFNPPTTYTGYSYPFDGEGYAGLVFYHFNSSQKEVMSVKLIDTLSVGKIYKVSFCFKNAELEGWNYAIDNIGVYFSEDTITIDEIHDSLAHIRTEKGVFLENTLNWECFSDYYYSKGNEVFLSIGSFGPKTETSGYFNSEVVNINSEFAYYYIDSVIVEECDEEELNKIILPNVFTPNNDGVNDQYKIEYGYFEEINVSIYNRWGELIKDYDCTKEVWDGLNSKNRKVVNGSYYVIARGLSKLGYYVEKKQIIYILQ